MNNQWSDNLRRRMEKHEEPSPEGLWEDIEQIMQKERALKPVAASPKIQLWSKRIAAAAAVVVIALVIGYYIPGRSGEDMPLAVETPEKQHTPENEASILQQRDILANNEDGFLPQNAQGEKVIPTEATPTDTISAIGNQENKPIQEIAEDDGLKPWARTEQGEDKNLYAQRSPRRSSDYDPNKYRNKQKGKPARVAANLYASNLPSGSKERHSGYGTLGAGEMRPDSEDDTAGAYGEIIEGNQYKEVYTDVRHRLPVAMGVSVNYSLNRKWSIAGGLAYTILSSELRSGSDSHYYKSGQTLHNIGIPLNINYNIWENRKFSIYLSAGGHVEKTVAGTLTTDYVVNNRHESTTKDNISTGRLQWSLNASAGIKYNLWDNIALYMEPGASYYFNNNSTIETIYKEKPLNLSLRLGLSFSLGGNNRRRQ